MIKTVAVIGAGRMGRQITMNTAIYGYESYVTDPDAAVLSDVENWVSEYLAGRVVKGRMTKETTQQVCSRIHIVNTMEKAVKNADLVIEAVTELEDIKRNVLHDVSELVREDTIITTNSSFMASSVFASAVKNPGRLANLHFFNPALVLTLTEVVQGPHTTQETADALMEFSRSIGKTPILVQKEIDGFVTNRILNACKNEALYLVENGYCTYADVDIACRNGLGHPVGPFELMDITGVDTTYYRMKREIEHTGVEPVGYQIIKDLFDKNWLGKKTGRGFYNYS